MVRILVIALLVAQCTEARQVQTKLKKSLWAKQHNLEEANCAEEIVPVLKKFGDTEDFACEDCDLQAKVAGDVVGPDCDDKLDQMNDWLQGMVGTLENGLPIGFNQLATLARNIYGVWHSNLVVRVQPPPDDPDDLTEKKKPIVWSACVDGAKKRAPKITRRHFRAALWGAGPYKLVSGGEIMRNLFLCVAKKLEFHNSRAGFGGNQKAILFYHSDAGTERYQGQAKANIISKLRTYTKSTTKTVMLEKGNNVFSAVAFSEGTRGKKVAFFIGHGNQDRGYFEEEGGVFFGGKVPKLYPMLKDFDPTMGSGREALNFVQPTSVNSVPTDLMFIGACYTGLHSDLAKAFMKMDKHGNVHGSRFVIAFRDQTAIAARIALAASILATEMAKKPGDAAQIPFAFKKMVETCYLPTTEEGLSGCTSSSWLQEKILSFPKDSQPVLYYSQTDVSEALEEIAESMEDFMEALAP